MEHEPKRRLPQAARYPIFLVGLLILMLGELAAYSSHAGVDTEAGVAVLGYVLILLSIVLK